MPNTATLPAIGTTDWELFEEEYADYCEWLNEQQIDEEAHLNEMYRYRLEEEDGYDAAFPF